MARGDELLPPLDVTQLNVMTSKTSDAALCAVEDCRLRRPGWGNWRCSEPSMLCRYVWWSVDPEDRPPYSGHIIDELKRLRTSELTR